MDIIKKLKKHKIFKFKTLNSSYAEKAALWERIEESIGSEKTSSFGTHGYLRFFLRVAAGIMLLIAFSLVFYKFQNTETNKEAPSYITKLARHGEKLTVTLLDGSSIKLNSGSKITYPQKFSDDLREVILEGEAFFQVSRNPHKPFVVKTENLSTTVLGTSFNISAYPEKENIQVSVVTGKVNVQETQSDRYSVAPVFLEPNHQATYSKKYKELAVTSFDAQEVTAWQNGTLVFKEASESVVIETLEKWYGVEIRVENTSPKKWDLTATFDNKTLEYVLDVISYTAKFKYSIKDKIITIKY